MIQYLVIVGAVVQLFGIASYMRETIRGNTKPNRVSWLMWSVAPIIATVAAVSGGVRWAILPVFMSGFAPLLVFLVSFLNKDSYWKLEKFDYLCGLFSILALILWGITKEPLVAILFSLLSDAFAAIPTIIKSWRFPETETVSAYSTGVFNAATSFFAIKTWGFLEVTFPVYLVLLNLLIVLLIVRRRLKIDG